MTDNRTNRVPVYTMEADLLGHIALSEPLEERYYLLPAVHKDGDEDTLVINTAWFCKAAGRPRQLVFVATSEELLFLRTCKAFEEAVA